MYVLRGIPVVIMGYSIDSLDVCFGDQLAGSVTSSKANLRLVRSPYFELQMLAIEPVSNTQELL